MNKKEFDEIINETMDICKDVLCTKGSEYAIGDRLHNFKVAAQVQNTTPINALAGMMCKHTVSVYDMCRQSAEGIVFTQDKWDEKIIDNINYLLILRAAVKEKFESEDK